MTALDDRVRKRAQHWLRRAAKQITFRRITTTAGPSPAVNPPSTAALLVDGAALAGAATIGLRAASVTGRLISGDKLTIAGVVYTVAAPVVASSNRFTGVSFAPTLAADVADGVGVTVTFAADTTVPARIGGFSEGLMGGGLIQFGDLSVQISALDLPVEPKLTDKLIIDGAIKTIVAVAPQHAAEEVAFWRIQAR